MTDVRSLVLVVLAAGCCATMATGHWTSADRIPAPAGGANSDLRPLYHHRRLLDDADGRVSDCVQRCACTMESMPLWVDVPLRWLLAARPACLTLCCVHADTVATASAAARTASARSVLHRTFLCHTRAAAVRICSALSALLACSCHRVHRGHHSA